MPRPWSQLIALLLLASLLPACPRRDDDDSADEDDDDDGNPEDQDEDGYCPAEACEDEELLPGDCDDEHATVNPDGEEVCDALDNDCDGRIDELFDADQDGYYDQFAAGCITAWPSEQLDCNDLIAAIHPGLEELCDGNDNDCNGEIDDGLDEDHDSFRICDFPADCDDTDPLVYPGAIETCDEEDDDCDGFVDNGEGADFADADADGWTLCEGDCDDADADVRPDAAEACDELDNDCDGDVDEDLDMDGDEWPGPYPDCYAEFGDVDCDDNDATVYPGGLEFCDGADNNCNGQVDENLDFDNDGFTSCQGDCNSLNPNVNPNAPELCDGLDNNCDGTVDDGWDDDGDGQSDCAGDCNDLNASIYLGAPELCDSLDNDCDGLLGPNEGDVDGDGFSECDGDCDEASVDVNPAAIEGCNGVDDDCDGAVPLDEQDDDLDGYIGCTPPGCAVALVNDQDVPAFWSTVGAFDALGIGLAEWNDAIGNAWLEDAGNFADSQVIVWYTGMRDISQAEHDAMEAWVQAGGGLVVTGPDALSNSAGWVPPGDDDDSAPPADDDDSAPPADDDDSARDFADFVEEEVGGALLADLIRSLTTGNGPQSTLCAVSHSANPVMNGPWGYYTTAFAFSASSSNHENAVANPARGALRIASVGSKAKLLYTPLISGGKILFWNGNENLGDWDPGFNPNLAAMLRNAIFAMNVGCGGALQGGDCDDSDATLYPGTCP